jgi:type IV secretory pathway protease TraF
MSMKAPPRLLGRALPHWQNPCLRRSERILLSGTENRSF